MKIYLKEKDINEFNKLLDIKDVNMSIADLLLDYFQNHKNDIDFNAFSAFEDLDDQKSFYYALMDIMQIDLENKENRFIGEKFILPGIKCLDIEKYEENPYFKNILVKNQKFHNLELNYLSYLPFEGFPFDDIKIDENDYYKEISQVGFFKKPYRFLALLENNEIWMSVNPNEIETMKKPIKNANGNIVVFGLGLGYFPYMCSLKKEVTHITIVENNQDIINLFKEKLLPLFEHKEKITIIKSDAFKYLKTIENDMFTYGFVDLWHNPNDGINAFLTFKSEESRLSKIQFDYWLEEGLLSLLRRCLITLIDEEMNGSTDENYKVQECETDKIINKSHFFLKNYEIKCFEDIKILLNDNSLKSIASKLYK
jgi:hypothetical protein